MCTVSTSAPAWTADRIKALRSRLGWTQRELAEALGYDHTRSVSEIEGGRRNPSGSASVLLDLIDQYDGLPARKGK